VEVAEKGLPHACPVSQPEEIRIQGIGELTGSATRIDRVGRSIEKRPLPEDEVLPCFFIPRRACTGDREVFEMKRVEVALELSRIWVASGKSAPRARLERLSEAGLRRAPTLALRLTIEALDNPFLNHEPGSFVSRSHEDHE